MMPRRQPTVTSGMDGHRGQVVLNNGDRVEYTVLILTLGTRWDGLWDFLDTKEEVGSMMQSSREKFREAKEIVIVGGGSSASELAGEIKDLDVVFRAFILLLSFLA
jgi:NADH dehydrogenase FAD-containing subunit